MSPVRDGGSPPPAGDELWTLPDSNDPDAIAEELNRRFRDRLRFFAARRLFDREGAEDVAQEVLRRVLEALRQPLEEGRVTISRAARTAMLDELRHVLDDLHAS